MKLFNHPVALRMETGGLILEIPWTEQTSDQMEDVNCAPRSKVIRAGTPNQETQVEIKAGAQVS